MSGRNPSSELTAEANRKLQLVTEDTLLQNIHLRESLDLMSEQIARLERERGGPSGPTTAPMVTTAVQATPIENGEAS